MRIWSLHPKYLDAKGLVALWRETLLARHVLEGKTNGYRHHPQLNRFRAAGHPLDAVNYYLSVVAAEATGRGYRFDPGKIGAAGHPSKLPVTRGQAEYERNHLLNKLKIRDHLRYDNLLNVEEIEVHPLFFITEGEVEDFEKV
jgi:hypothetical protein